MDMLDTNYVIDKTALDFALQLHESSMKDTQKMGESLMNSYRKQIEELQKDLNMSNEYIYYVNKCVKLQCVPRNFDFWFGFIRE
jgi:hypothetical protein